MVGEKDNPDKELARLRAENAELEEKVKDRDRRIENYRYMLRRQGGLINTFRELAQNHEFERVSAYLELFEGNDPYTCGHSHRVTKYAIMIGRAIGLSEDEIQLLHKAAHLHDIGKIRWNEEDFLIKKPTPENIAKFREHAVLGAKYLEELAKTHKEYEGLAIIVRYHHERYDGRSIITHPNERYVGYPGEVSGEDIPFLSRIITLADCLDAMTTDRAYKPKMTIENAIEEIKRCAMMEYIKELIPNKGPELQFDPKVVEAFLKIKTVGSQKTGVAHKLGCIKLLEIDSMNMIVNPEDYLDCDCIQHPSAYVMYHAA
ncbi:HD domain-containing protein [Candidatus Woesearchaeota archaeon]|nr:HD domain-containing protein [Candidatus Woesearchaeota archaeon]